MRQPAAPASRRWFSLRRLGLGLLLASVLLVLPHLGGGTELVRLGHALALGPDLDPAQDWTPAALPADYLRDDVAPDPAFTAAVGDLQLQALPDDWARGVAIARHLLSAPQLNGGAIQKDLRSTYLAIVERGDGYCGDFVRAFTGLATAAGITARPWAFSFDGFGGHGHIWVEIWNRQSGRWQLLDVFNNYYFTDGSNEPLSALGLRAALQARSPALQLRLLHPGARPGYAIEAKAWDYFRRGLDQWYMPWGNNVFGADQAWQVRTLGAVSRAAEGIGALLAGQQPPVRMLVLPESAEQRVAMRWLRVQLLLALVLGTAGLLLWLFGPRPVRVWPAASGGWPRVCIVGPMPPPSGGMANQCEQLQRLLREEGVSVSFVRTNAPYWPRWVGGVPVLRAGFRLLPYLGLLWRGVGRAEVVHLFANSGWAWHLLAAPAIVIARLRRVPVIVNYRGGQADSFFSTAPRHVQWLLRLAALRVTPSAFLVRVFARHGLQAEIIPNIIDLSRFTPASRPAPGDAPHLIVTRNLEPIYDIPTALRAFAQVRQARPGARLTVAGSGPELVALQALATQLDVADAVQFSGRIANASIGALYASADLMLNPSTADNMPISILEALASGVPVVSTDVGGIPDLVTHERTALLVPVGDAPALAAAALRVLDDPALAQRLREAGCASVARYAWPQVRAQWLEAYRRAARAAADAGGAVRTSRNIR